MMLHVRGDPATRARKIIWKSFSLPDQAETLLVPTTTIPLLARTHIRRAMVSALWKACAAEVQDLESVQQLLKEPGVDVEIKGECGDPAPICTSGRCAQRA
jgi:hypothetical protein